MSAIPKDDIRFTLTNRRIHFHANKTRIDLFNLLYDISILIQHLPDFGIRWQLLTGEIMIAVIQHDFIIRSSKNIGLCFQNPNPQAEN